MAREQSSACLVCAVANAVVYVKKHPWLQAQHHRKLEIGLLYKRETMFRTDQLIPRKFAPWFLGPRGTKESKNYFPQVMFLRCTPPVYMALRVPRFIKLDLKLLCSFHCPYYVFLIKHSFLCDSLSIAFGFAPELLLVFLMCL